MVPSSVCKVPIFKLLIFLLINTPDLMGEALRCNLDKMGGVPLNAGSGGDIVEAQVAVPSYFLFFFFF